MVHCRSCVMDYFNFSFSAFRSSRLRSCSLAVLSTQRFRESMTKEISSSFLLIKAKSLISASLILPSRAIWISRPVRVVISFRPATVSRMILTSQLLLLLEHSGGLFHICVSNNNCRDPVSYKHQPFE